MFCSALSKFLSIISTYSLSWKRRFRCLIPVAYKNLLQWRLLSNFNVSSGLVIPPHATPHNRIIRFTKCSDNSNGLELVWKRSVWQPLQKLIPLSQAAACDGQVYTVNYTNSQPGTQTNLLPLFEDWKHYKIQLNVNPGQIQPPPHIREDTIPTHINLRIFIYLDTYFISV